MQHQDNSWKEANSKKRPRNSPESTNSYKRQSSISDYWLNKPIPTENPFDVLSVEDSASEEKSTEQKTKSTKSPPIFVSGVKYIRPLSDLLDVIAKDEYTLKALQDDQVKIQPSSADKYLPIIEALKSKKTEFYTYQRKQDRNFKVILRNMHASVDIQLLTQEIEANNHKVKSIVNILQNNTKRPLPLFLVEIEANENNKEIYQIKQLLNTIISFEQPRKKRELPQCMRCQAYGHTKSYCFKSPRCVKCAATHLTADCPMKGRNAEVKCFNCGGNHPASYKGCSVRKQLQQKLFPPLREKETSPTVNLHANGPIPNAAQPKTTYAQAAKSMPHHEATGHQQHVGALTPHQPNSALEGMIAQLMTKIDSMLNLLTTLIARLP